MKRPTASKRDGTEARRFLLVPIVALALTSCGGTATKTVFVGSTSSNSTTTNGGSGSANERQVVMEQARLIYLPDQTGGNFHTVLVLLRNGSNETAVDVGGQISILDERGQLVKSIEPTEVTILPHGQGLLQEDADLPKPLPHGKLEVHLVVSRFVPGGRSPVSFSKLRYRHDSIGACSISGVVSNRFTERKQNLQLRIAGFTARRLATGDFTYVDKVFPRIDATFEVDMFGSALCPRRLNRIRVLPNLSEDKIFNP